MSVALGSARSLLFVPGDRPDRFDKALAAGADAVILDLEDAVAPDHKDSARDAVVAWLTNTSAERAQRVEATSPSVPVLVRINAAGTPQHDADRAALAGIPADRLTAVLLPKAEDPEQIRSIAEATGRPVLALIETALGLHRAVEVAAEPAVTRLCLGHLDLAADLGCAPSRTAMLTARSTLVLASRLADKPAPIDGVTPALDDPAALTEDIRHAVELGFTGKLLIHPRQVEPTHDALRPEPAELDWATRVLAADGTGAARVDGVMVDAPVLTRARQLLARADPTGKGIRQ
ncbi:citrate lyase subunit beta/citryl-CoA lyase [Propionibacteriaceae bacterium ES.041]|uniref:HpcH/HpaI aldolase/citrate lyase family protein n=1 Tax=Enemella evansiae TaxID=2016499 RepID=UPI000B979797|nr:CoA ester lyase [Enemella evansiae]OYN99001.1 CoA ester lyase [Enemella evansiae]PFG67475.1 citrate lyase subunit beta/citryl-CoA lyase [Propionibacteriaceae bacterium ES.041]